MNENLSIQTEQNTKHVRNKFSPFQMYQKHTISISITLGLLFLVVGVGAFYLGKQSVNKKQTLYPTPTSVLFPSINQIYITNIPTQNIEQDCAPPPDCVAPPRGCNYEYMYDKTGCLTGCGNLNCAQITTSCPKIIPVPCPNDKLPNGCGYSAMPIPPGCPGGCPVICSSNINK